MFRGFFKRIFKFLLQIHQENSFYLSVNIGKPIFLAFLVFVGKCTSVSFVDEMSFSENVAKWDVKTASEPRRPFQHSAPVSKHTEMRSRLLGWTISYKSLYFVHSSLEFVPSECGNGLFHCTARPMSIP